MAELGVKVLLGDSQASNLDPGVLDLIVQLVTCSREVATSIVEVDTLEAQRFEALESTNSILADLARFSTQAEFGLRATANDMKREEMIGHGEEAIAAVKKMVEGWRSRYSNSHDSEKSRVDQRISQLQKDMIGSVGKFVLPLRKKAPERTLERVFEGTKYNDQASVELVPGVWLRLALQDNDPEQPRRVRTLIGKGFKVQVGTKLSMIRRTEEPNFVPLDDMLVLEAEITQERALLVLAKKPAAKDRLALELTAVGDGAQCVALKSDGGRAMLPPSDAPVVKALWQALQKEVKRVIACPAALYGLTLDDVEVDDAATMLDCMERLVKYYRPVVSKIAKHSPNSEELTIKIERNGKREEAWIRRPELAQHYLAMQAEQRRRLRIPELDTGLDVSPSAAASSHPAAAAVKQPHAGNKSEKIALELDDAGVPIEDLTEDISLRDIVLEGEDADDDGCVAPTRIRTRPD